MRAPVGKPAGALTLRSGVGGPPKGGPPTLCCVRSIFRHVHAAAKNDSDPFRRWGRRKPGRGFGPFLEFSRDGGQGSPVGCLLLWEVFAGRGAVGAASAAGLWKIRRDGDDLRENACIGRAGKV